MSANKRIQWLHSRIAEGHYPNASRIAEKFGVSHRQAQRDVDFLRAKLGAPIEYNAEHRGFYYTKPFSFPIYITSDNDDEYSGFAGKLSAAQHSESTLVQMQIPYNAEIEVKNKLGVIELKNFIVSQSSKNKYVCEFHSVELFLGVLISINADIKILSPDWLRKRALDAAKRIISNNQE